MFVSFVFPLTQLFHVMMFPKCALSDHYRTLPTLVVLKPFFAFVFF